MLARITLAAGLIAAGAAFTSASAAPALPQSKPITGEGLVLQVKSHHHHHHGHVRFYRRGVAIGVIGGYGYCSAWRSECAANYGWRTRSFYRCLWRHGC
jgi:hypothetical protein